MTALDDLVARVKSAGAKRVYKIGAVPADPGDAYLVLGLQMPTANARRLSGEASTRGRRLVAQAFGRSETGAVDMADYADAAFDEQTLTEFSHAPFCVREMTVGPIRDPDDDGWLQILNTYRL